MGAVLAGGLALVGCSRDPAECISTSPAPLQVQAVIGERTDTSFLLSWTCAGGMDVVDATLESPTRAFTLTMDDPSAEAASQVRAALIGYEPVDEVPDDGELTLVLEGEEAPVVLEVEGLPVGLALQAGLPPSVFEDCVGVTTMEVVNVGPASTNLGFGLGRSDLWSLGEPLPQTVQAGESVVVPLEFHPVAGSVNERVLFVAESAEGHRVGTRILGTVLQRYDLVQHFEPAGLVGPLLFSAAEDSVSGVALPSGEAIEVALEPDGRVRVAGWPEGAEELEIHYDRDVLCDDEGS